MAIPQTNFNPPFNITRASHLVLTAQDLPASRDFYTQVLGLVVSDEDANTIFLRGLEERGHHSLTLKKTTAEPTCLPDSVKKTDVKLQATEVASAASCPR